MVHEKMCAGSDINFSAAGVTGVFQDVACAASHSVLLGV